MYFHHRDMHFLYNLSPACLSLHFKGIKHECMYVSVIPGWPIFPSSPLPLPTHSHERLESVRTSEPGRMGVEKRVERKERKERKEILGSSLSSLWNIISAEHNRISKASESHCVYGWCCKKPEAEHIPSLRERRERMWKWCWPHVICVPLNPGCSDL